MNVSLQQLRVFVAVARQRSFTRAAREFALTQSAVSRCVRELEEAIDLRLFDRTTRQVELTPAGANLERRIGRLLDEIDLTLREERMAHEGHTGMVAVAVSPTLSSNWLPGALARCATAFPELVVSARDWSHDAVIDSVEQGEVDFGVILSSVAPNPDTLHAQPLFTTTLCALLSVSHPFARRASLEWSALNDLPLITLNPESGVRTAVDGALHTQRVHARAIQALGQAAAVLRMVELGLGVGVLPVDARETLASTLVAVPLLPETTLTAQLIRRRNRSLRPNADAVWAQFARGSAATTPAAFSKKTWPAAHGVRADHPLDDANATLHAR